MKSCTAGIRRLLSAFVALVMVLCLLPSTALAAAPTKVAAPPRAARPISVSWPRAVDVVGIGYS